MISFVGEIVAYNGETEAFYGYSNPNSLVI